MHSVPLGGERVSHDAGHKSLVGSTLCGYRLVSVVGSGGMADVYRAVDAQRGSEVAIKVLPAALARDPSYVARFRDEAQRVAALAHPHVVPLYRYAEERGEFCIIMPLIKESLRDRMDLQRVVHPVDAARIVVQIASALDAAHRQGLVHRDVKPENILIDADGRAMLTDFGIARELDVLRDGTSARTPSVNGLPVGTPEYMSPEQLRGGAADQRMDVYGLGAVLYEMVTGRVPHLAMTPYEIAIKTLTERAIPPSALNRAIWPELEEVILGALSSDPQYRYPTMHSFASALHRAVLARTSQMGASPAHPSASQPFPVDRSSPPRHLADANTAAMPALAPSVGRAPLSHHFDRESTRPPAPRPEPAQPAHGASEHRIDQRSTPHPFAATHPPNISARSKETNASASRPDSTSPIVPALRLPQLPR